MKRLLRKIILNKIFARLMIKPVLAMHSLSYAMAARLSIVIEGVHPKHRILRYKEWFLEQIKPGWVIVDVGSSVGLMASLLAAKVSFVYAIEVKKELVKEARLKRPGVNIEYICADAINFDFNKCRKVDCVILSNILEHIEQRVVFLRRITDALDWKDRDRRRFLFRVPMQNRDWIVPYKNELGMDSRSDKTHFVEYTFENFKSELHSAGIEIIDYNIRFGEIYANAVAMSKGRDSC